MANNIVTIDVTVTSAPTPSTVQRTGALVSQGATDLAEGAYSLLTQLSDLTPLLTPAAANTSLTWSGGVVTADTTAAHGIPIGDEMYVTIAGAVPAAYNGTFLATSTGASAFTYPLAGNPGTSPASTPGTWIPGQVAQLVAMATTFFGQGNGLSCYVLELGPGNTALGVTNLNTFIEDSPQFFYSYLFPREFAAEATLPAFLAQFENPNSKTYFFITCTTGNYTNFTALEKCAVTMIEAPGIPATEFSLASMFFRTLNYNPSPTNKVPPTAFAFVFGVTAYPTVGNQALLATLKAANVNIIGTGGEGGITNTILFWGTTMDGNDFSWWYSVDWMQINIELNIANAVINGSNNFFNPLYLNQPGINSLQAVAANTANSGISAGLVLGSTIQTELTGAQLQQNYDAGTYDGNTVVNAVPFASYYTANPGDFKIGKYAGFSIIYSPNRGFVDILFNINVTTFPVAAAA
jgi:hypothetical protein